MEIDSFCQTLREALKSEGRAVIRVTGTSMLPSIPPGVRLELCALRPRDPETGRIYLFRDARGLHAHRFDGYVGAEACFTGDNNRRPERIPRAGLAEALIGRAERWRLLGVSVPLEGARALPVTLSLAAGLRVVRLLPAPARRALRRWIVARLSL
jgi:hypothetical protein